MTLIVGLIEKNKAYIGSDQMGSNGHSGGIYHNKKVFKIGKDILAGGCGSYKELQILEKEFTPPERTVDQSSADYMYKSFAPALKKILKDNDLLTNKDGVLNNKHGEFIFIYDNVIYKWQSDLALLETVLPYDTTGSGEEYAHAVMATINKLKSDLTPEDKIKLAISLTSDYVVSVGGEPVIVSGE